MRNVTLEDALKAVELLTDAVLTMAHRIDHQTVGLEDVIQQLRAIQERVKVKRSESSIVKCEDCEVEAPSPNPSGWTTTCLSKWKKEYHLMGWAQWCPACGKKHSEAMKNAHLKKSGRETMAWEEFSKLVMLCSPKTPSPVELGGRRSLVVKGGLMDDGPATGQEILIVCDEGN
jgi:hypothetical protein